MRYPKAIQKGDTIGITAPSDGNVDVYFDSSIQELEKRGFSVIETEHVRNSCDFVSSEGETRTKEWMELWRNPNVSYIIAASGGEFLIDMLPSLHSQQNEIVRTEQIKWVQGYSDVSLLNYYLTTMYDIATIHANNAGSFAMQPYDVSIENNLNLVTGEYASHPFVQTSFPLYQLERNEDATKEYILTEPVVYRSLIGGEKIQMEGRILRWMSGYFNSIIGYSL